MTSTDTNTRDIEKTLDIDVPADAVWEALTDPTELQRWFPLEAQVEPGVGGHIVLSWGDFWRGTHDIQIWEPGARLRMGWPVGNESEQVPVGESFEAPEDEAGNMANLSVDFDIQGEGGSTRLRVLIWQDASFTLLTLATFSPVQLMQSPGEHKTGGTDLVAD